MEPDPRTLTMEHLRILVLLSELEIMGPWFRRLRPLAKLHHHLPAGFRFLWYGPWSSRLHDYEVVVLLETYWVKDVVQYICRKNTRCRVIVYYNNLMQGAEGRSCPMALRGLPCELYSFDKGDCSTFGMKYSPWCLLKTYPLKSVPASFDTFFIGRDKGRLPELLDLERHLNKLGCRNRFIIVRDKGKKYSTRECRHLSKESVRYPTVVEMIQESRCLIEVLQAGQSGISERTMEALVYRKKLITNNKDIVSCDFYRKENIFVLGNDPLERLPDFMNCPLVPVGEHIVQRYTYEAWLQRFFEP